MLQARLDAILDETFGSPSGDTGVSADTALKLHQQQFWTQIIMNGAESDSASAPFTSLAGAPVSMESVVRTSGTVLTRLVETLMAKPPPKLSLTGASRRRKHMQEQVVALTAAAFEGLSDYASQACRAEAVERAREDELRLQAETAQHRNLIATTEALSRLADGDLTVRVDGLSSPFLTLESAFNLAVGSLQTRLRSVSASTLDMNSGIDMISEGASDLFKRTDEQAQSVERTAVTVGQITATVRKTAKRIEHARLSISGAKADAEKSGSIVQEAVSAMAEIEHSS
ncbi:methyl-accepting chemotaxis protein, partial [Hyphomicrobiales bacterium BP6-180914]